MKLCVVMLVMMRMEYVVEMFTKSGNMLLRVGIFCREWEYVVEMFTKSGILKVWPHKGTAIPVTWAPPVAFLEREDFFQNLIVKKHVPPP